MSQLKGPAFVSATIINFNSYPHAFPAKLDGCTTVAGELTNYTLTSWNMLMLVSQNRVVVFFLCTVLLHFVLAILHNFYFQ